MWRRSSAIRSATILSSRMGSVRLAFSSMTTSRFRSRAFWPRRGRRSIEPCISALRRSKLAVFKLQRAINEYRVEPLLAILPGATLQELWGLVGTAETALATVSAMVVGTALLGMVTMILTTLNER